MDLNEPPEAASQVVDLEECIEIEVDRQANEATDKLELPALPDLKTPLLSHQIKNVIRMIKLETARQSILQSDGIGMGKTYQTLCLIASSLDRQAQSPYALEPGQGSYFAPAKAHSRLKWDGARMSERQQQTEPMVEVLLSGATLIVVQKAHVGHWASEIRKHFNFPEKYVTEEPEKMDLEQLKKVPIILLAREKLTESYRDRASVPWFFKLRFLRLVLDEGGSSTGSFEKTRHATMIQALHTDSKVLVDATPYHRGDSRASLLRKLKELGATRAFFSSTRNYEELKTEWKEKVLQAKGVEQIEVAKDMVLKFLQKHLVRSQVADRPPVPQAEAHEIMLKYTKSQALSYNRLIQAQILACLTCAETLASDRWLKETWRHLEDCTMDANSYDHVCNPDGLLIDFDKETLKQCASFKGGPSAIETQEKELAKFVEILVSQGIPQQRIDEIRKKYILQRGVEPTTCPTCTKEGSLPNFSPRCGHMFCVDCVFQQKREQQAAGNDSAPLYVESEWTEEALDALDFECSCGQNFTMKDLCQNPEVCFVSHGLSYQGSPKLAKIMDFVLKEHPNEKVLIYCTCRRHRDTVANYIHSKRLLVADLSQSGSCEKKEDRAKMVDLIERFKQPVYAASGSNAPPVNVALAAGTSTSTGVRGLDLPMLDHILIVGGRLDPRVYEQLVGRGVRIGQTDALQVWTLHVEGTFEDARVCDRTLSRQEQLLSLKPVEDWTDEEPDHAYDEAFPQGCVVWWATDDASHLAQVRPNSRMYQTLGQRGKVYVEALLGKSGWADPQDLTKFNETSLRNLNEASWKALGPNPESILQLALTQARRVGQVGNEDWEERIASEIAKRNKGAGKRRVSLTRGGGVAEDTRARENDEQSRSRDERERQRKGKRTAAEDAAPAAKRPTKRQTGTTFDEEIDMEEEQRTDLLRPQRNPNTMVRRQELDREEGARHVGDERRMQPSSKAPLVEEAAAALEAQGTPISIEREGSAFASSRDAANSVEFSRLDPLNGGDIESDDEAFLERLRTGAQKRRCRRAVQSDDSEGDEPPNLLNSEVLVELAVEEVGPSQGGQLESAEVEEQGVGEHTENMLAQSTEDSDRQLAAAVVCVPTELQGVSSARAVPATELPAVTNILPPVADNAPAVADNAPAVADNAPAVTNDAPAVVPQKLLEPEPSSAPECRSNQTQGAAFAVPFAPISPPPQIRQRRQLALPPPQPSDRHEILPNIPATPPPAATWQPGTAGTPSVRGLALAAPQPSDRNHISREIPVTPPLAVTWQQETAGPSGTANERPPAENREAPVGEEERAQEPSEDEKKQALKKELQSWRVPAASIEQLLQRDFTIDHLELGMLSRQEVRQLVEDGELPKEHFETGTLVKLDWATKRYKKVPA